MDVQRRDDRVVVGVLPLHEFVGQVANVMVVDECYRSHDLLIHATPLVLDESVSFSTAVNSACAGLPVDAGLRQRLLEEDDLMFRQRLALEVLDRVLTRLLEMKRRDGGGAPN